MMTLTIMIMMQLWLIDLRYIENGYDDDDDNAQVIVWWWQ